MYQYMYIALSYMYVAFFRAVFLVMTQKMRKMFCHVYTCHSRDLAFTAAHGGNQCAQQE